MIEAQIEFLSGKLLSARSWLLENYASGTDREFAGKCREIQSMSRELSNIKGALRRGEDEVE